MICLLRGREKGGDFRESRRMCGKEREGAVLWWPIACFAVLGRLQSSFTYGLDLGIVSPRHSVPISQTVAHVWHSEVREKVSGLEWLFPFWFSSAI